MGLWNQPGTEIVIAASQPSVTPEGTVWYDTATDLLKTSDGSTFTQVGKSSFAGAAVVSQSTTIGDYTTPSSAFAEDATFSDRYTTNTGWTQTSTEITVDSGTADACHFAGATATGPTYRAVHKSLGTTLSDTKWIMRFKYVYTSTAGGGPLHFIACLRAGTSNPTTTGDHIAILHHATYTGIIIDAKDGDTVTGNTTGLQMTSGNTYYVQLERTSATNIKISAFTGSDFSTGAVTNSPQNFTIASTVGNSLTTLIHSNISTNGAEALTADIDDIQIWNNANAADIITINNIFDDNTATKWTSASVTNPAFYVDMGSALNLCAVALYWDSTSTETEIKIQTSADASTWTDKRKITTSNLTNGAYNYYRFNIAGGARYVRIYGTGTAKVLSSWEIKVLKKTDAEIFADMGIVEISSTDTSLDGDGV